ncbi:glycosyltransferase [Halobacillus sp. K22]|uniref:glycosyltransferase n=1 Tax=Halobacillus sp. K22 TaxID=3457431 RepID=UPI003FCC68ED
MKKILMVVYNDLNTDARVQRAATALAEDYDVTVISYGEPINSETGIHNITINNKKKSSSWAKYINFVKEVIAYAKSNKHDLFYAHDYYSAIPLLFLKTIIKRKNIYVYDSHELNFMVEKAKGVRSKLFNYVEKISIKKSDLVICANNNRGNLMKAYLNLKKDPLVIKNISYLTVFESSSSKDMQKRIDDVNSFISKDKVTLVYAGAITKKRNIDKVIDTVYELGDEFQFLIIGDGPFYKDIELKICNLNAPNSKIIPSVPYKNLASFLVSCDIGYLFYPNHGLNNVYCASNKVYEYASVNVPMVSFYNPTLREIFDRYQIGIADNSLKQSLIRIKQNYMYYKSNLTTFINDNKWEDEKAKLKNSIFDLLKEG